MKEVETFPKYPELVRIEKQISAFLEYNDLKMNKQEAEDGVLKFTIIDREGNFVTPDSIYADAIMLSIKNSPYEFAIGDYDVDNVTELRPNISEVANTIVIKRVK